MELYLLCLENSMLKYFNTLFSSRLLPIFQMANSDDLDNDIDELLQDFEAKCQRPILHCLLFY